MSALRVPWRAALHPDVAAEVVKQAVHAAQGVTAARWDTEGPALVVDLHPGVDAESARSLLERYLAAMIARHRPLPREIVRVQAASRARPRAPGAEGELEARGWLRHAGPGQVVLAGPPLAFLRALDRRLADLGAGRFGAREEAYPALIPTDVLHRCGYFTSFPHTVSMVTHLTEDFDAIDRFRAANAGAAHLAIPDPAALAPAPACLTPAVCYHCYAGLAGAVLPEGGRFVTAVGRCFRYESRNMQGLSRLWDFSMREIIACGTEPEVAAARGRLLDAACELAASLDLDFVVESATDPFFSAAYAEKAYWQTRHHLKLEMRLRLADSVTRTPPAPQAAPTPGPPAAGLGGDTPPPRTAAASFNLHEDFFGRTFGFTAGGAPAFTGCAAWGLERWVLAAFTQHGLEPADWPEPWRAPVFGDADGGRAP
jgi:hypothetical protein